MLPPRSARRRPAPEHHDHAPETDDRDRAQANADPAILGEQPAVAVMFCLLLLERKVRAYEVVRG